MSCLNTSSRFANKECHGNCSLISKEQHGDLQLGSWQSRGQPDYRASRKKPEVRKAKTYLDNPSLWLERAILKEQENVFLFGLGLIALAVLKCLF